MRELREWLGLLEDLLLSQKVTVCRTQEVEQVLTSHQVRLIFLAIFAIEYFFALFVHFV